MTAGAIAPVDQFGDEDQVVLAEPTAGELAVPADAASRLSDEAAELIHDSVPAETRRAYAGDWRRYTAWCAGRDLAPLPSAPAQLANYLTVLTEQGKAPSTIDRALASIVVAHRAAGVPVPDTVPARRVLLGYRRRRAEQPGTGVRKAAPVTVGRLRAMVATLPTAAGEDEPDPLASVRDRCLLVLGFALGCRRGELAALDVADVTVTDAGLDVVVRKSKTDQAAAGRTVTVLYGSDPATCPVRLTRTWLARRAAAGLNPEHGPLLVLIDRHGRAGVAAAGRGPVDGRLSGQAVAIVVRRAAQAAGFDPADCWSGHSLRRGFATEAYTRGADPLRIARHAGWTDGSSTLLGYVEEVERVKANPLAGIGL